MTSNNTHNNYHHGGHISTTTAGHQMQANRIAASHGKRGGAPGAGQKDVPNNNDDEDHEQEIQLLYDSGRESPTAGSAIVRRRRHRASKSTAAWLTQAQTVHPKSSKSTIEKLMALILEQGETIQHQLSKLRDREIQISQLEEQKHKIREQEHGKNYLLETYLNGLHEAEEKDLTTINSDSGVNTEDTQSPNGGTSPTAALEGGEEKLINPSAHTKKSHFDYTERENELLRDHLKLKLTSDVATTKAPAKKSSKGHQRSARHNGQEEVLLVDDHADSDNEENGDWEDEIGMLEKIYVINKHLQKEEELLVRLNAKIKRYESENPNLGEDEILETLNRLNSEIEQRSREIEITNREIELSDELLNKKSAFLQELGTKLEATVTEEATLMAAETVYPVKPPMLVEGQTEISSSARLQTGLDGFDVNPENIYNISKILLKYSDDGLVVGDPCHGGIGSFAPETGRDWHNDRVNLAACQQASLNKTDTNKRIIIDDSRATEMGASAIAIGPGTHHTVTTQVQIHRQPGHNHVANNHSRGQSECSADYLSHSTGNHYHQHRQTDRTNLYSQSPVDPTALVGAAGAHVTDFTPVDLIAQQRRTDAPLPIVGAATTAAAASAGVIGSRNQGNHTSTANYNMHVVGISDKVGAINSTRNISATLMDNKKLATKSFALTSKAYEGLARPVAPAAVVVGATAVEHQLPARICPQTDMTQLGTLV